MGVHVCVCVEGGESRHWSGTTTGKGHLETPEVDKAKKRPSLMHVEGAGFCQNIDFRHQDARTARV